MRLLTASVLVLATAGFAIGQAPGASDASTLVLVGVHQREGAADAGPSQRNALRTLAFDVGSRTVTALPALLVPRRSGFWWVDLEDSCREEPHEAFDGSYAGHEVNVADTVRAFPVGALPTSYIFATLRRSTPCRAAEVFCITDARHVIRWVWPEYISMSDFIESGCGAHPDSTLSPGLRRLDSIGSALPIATVFGRSTDRALRRAFGTAKMQEAIARDPECADLAAFDPTSWHIVRRRGSWKIEAWSATRRLCGGGIDYTVETDLSPVTGRRVALPSAAFADPEVEDAFASPDGRWMLLVTASQVRLVSTAARSRVIASAPLTVSDAVVMVEWAVGSGAQRWREQVTRLAAATAKD